MNMDQIRKNLSQKVEAFANERNLSVVDVSCQTEYIAIQFDEFAINSKTSITNFEDDNHTGIQFYSSHLGNTPHTRKLFMEATLLLMDFWKNHYSYLLEGVEGVIFLSEEKLITYPDEFLNAVQSNLDIDVRSFFRKFLWNHCFQFIGAEMSDSLKERIHKFEMVRAAIDSVIEGNELLFSDFLTESLYTFIRPIKMHYYGEEFYFKINKWFDEITITCCQRNKNKRMTFSTTADAFNNALQEIEEDNRLLNLFNPPTRNLDRLLHTINSGWFKPAQVTEITTKLIEYLGSWEELEIQSYHLNNALKSETLRYKDIPYGNFKVRTVQNDKFVFHFVFYNEIYDNWDYKEVFVSKPGENLDSLFQLIDTIPVRKRM